MPDFEAKYPGSRVIKRYGNRRLYDSKLSRSVTMDEVAEYVRKGEDVRVFDGDTGEDLTKRVLTQIILEQSNGRVLELLPVEFLRRLLLVRSDAASEWVARYLSLGAQFLEKQMSATGPAAKVMNESLSAIFPWMQDWMPVETTVPPPAAPREEPRPGDDAALRSQMAELERRMAELAAQMHKRARR